MGLKFSKHIIHWMVKDRLIP